MPSRPKPCPTGFSPLPFTNYPHGSLDPKLASLPSSGVGFGDGNHLGTHVCGVARCLHRHNWPTWVLFVLSKGNETISQRPPSSTSWAHPAAATSSWAGEAWKALTRSSCALLLVGCFKKPDAVVVWLFFSLFGASLRIKFNDGYKSVARYQNVVAAGGSPSSRPILVIKLGNPAMVWAGRDLKKRLVPSPALTQGRSPEEMQEEVCVLLLGEVERMQNLG